MPRPSPTFVRDPRQLWETFQLAKLYNTTPALILGIRDDLLSWQINRAVATFGRALEEKLHQVSSKASKQRDAERKMKQTLDKWMTSADPVDAPAKGRYRDPMAMI